MLNKNMKSVFLYANSRCTQHVLTKSANIYIWFYSFQVLLLKIDKIENMEDRTDDPSVTLTIRLIMQGKVIFIFIVFP